MRVREPESVHEHIDALQQQVSELKKSVDQTRRETTQQLTARLEQVRALRSHIEAATDDAVQAADQSQNPWQAMRADLAAKMRDLRPYRAKAGRSQGRCRR